MRRTSTGFFIVCTLGLLAASITSTNASISSHNWIGSLIRNTHDSFYGTTITGYEEGSTAQLVVNVYNDYWFMGGYRQVNISAVIVEFDWGQNFSSTEATTANTFPIPPLESHVFTLSFTVPSASDVSNLVTHSYRVIVEHVNSTGGDKKDWTDGGYAFAVFSSNQADAYRAKREIEAYPTLYLPFLTAKARELLTRSSVAESMGSSEYRAGNFGSAKTYYEDASSLLQQAYSNETDRWGSFEYTFESLLKGAEMLLMYQGYAWLIIGIGFFLISIGVVVYLVRKSGTPKS